MVVPVRRIGSAQASSGSTERRRRFRGGARAASQEASPAHVGRLHPTGFPSHPRHAPAIAVAVIVIAFGLRIAEVQRTSYTPINDARSYLALASQIAQTGDYSSTDRGAGGSRGPTAYLPPAFPYFLAAIDEIDSHKTPGGPAVRPARIAGAVLGTLIVVLIGLIAMELLGEVVGLLALAIAAVYPPLIALSGVIVAENLLVTLELAAVWTTLRARHSHAAAWPMATGVLVGLAALTHQNGILLALPLAFGLARLRGMARPRRSGPVMMLCAAALVIAPWLIRDAVVMHTFVPIADETGITLAGTYNPTSAVSIGPPYNWVYYRRIFADRDIAAQAASLTEPQLDRHLISRSLSYVNEHPFAPLAVAFDNTLRLLELEGSHAWKASTASIGINESTAQIGVLGFWLLGALAIAGAFTRLAREVPAWVWATPVLMALSVVFVNAETPRFREPIDPFLILLAACALATAWLAVTGRRGPQDWDKPEEPEEPLERPLS